MTSAEGALSLEQAMQQAIAHHQAGRLPDAERLYRAILRVQPQHPAANHNLGVLAVQMKQPAAGLPHFRVALENAPDQPQHWISIIDALIMTGQVAEARQLFDEGCRKGLQGAALDALAQKLGGTPVGEGGASLQQAVEHHQAGRLAEAEALYRQILGSMPGHPDALHLLGVICRQRGDIDAAVELIRKAITANPAEPVYCYNLGRMLLDRGELDDAVASYRQALSLKPDYAEACNGLGGALRKQGQLDAAIAAYLQAVSLRPDYAEAHCNLGSALQAQERLDDAALHFKQALTLQPDYAEAHCYLGNTLKELGRLDEAVACYRQALRINPAYTEAHYNLGNALQKQGRLTEAADSYRNALSVKSDYAEAIHNLGNVFQEQGRLAEAIEAYRKALLTRPGFSDVHSSLIFAMDMQADVDAATLLAERQSWSTACAEHLCGEPVFFNRPDPERRLRIGYVSADFKQHSAAVCFGTMLTRFDPAVFDVFAYSSTNSEDGHTRLFQKSVTAWRSITKLSDSAVADLIRQDGIDILVDLSGHSGCNRLLVFARKPAPIQITAWGYAGGSGMKAMNVLLTDPVIVPPGEKQYYVEEVRYLPSVVSTFFPNPFPPVNPLPAVAVGRVTFGSFNRLAKMSAETFATWARVLTAIPTSTLMLKTAELDDAGTRDIILGHFAHAGVDPARITLLGRSGWTEHMAAFNRIDISLDTFPQSGGVTTLEGLMMGVPVITLRGNTFVGRGSASLLTTLNLTDWIAETPEQYVDIAVQKAEDLTALAVLRQQLRSRFMSSILGDTAAYAKVVAQEYRKLWREWCDRQHDGIGG